MTGVHAVDPMGGAIPWQVTVYTGKKPALNLICFVDENEICLGPETTTTTTTTTTVAVMPWTPLDKNITITGGKELSALQRASRGQPPCGYQPPLSHWLAQKWIARWPHLSLLLPTDPPL